jgi:hypothetical protein
MCQDRQEGACLQDEASGDVEAGLQRDALKGLQLLGQSALQLAVQVC